MILCCDGSRTELTGASGKKRLGAYTQNSRDSEAMYTDEDTTTAWKPSPFTSSIRSEEAGLAHCAQTGWVLHTAKTSFSAGSLCREALSGCKPPGGSCCHGQFLHTLSASTLGFGKALLLLEAFGVLMAAVCVHSGLHVLPRFAF